MRCLICGQETKRPVAAFLTHFKPYEYNGFKYYAGNKSMFGAYDAFWSCVYLTSPLIKTIRFWKTRKMTLDFGQDPMVLHALVIEGEKLNKE